MSAKMLAVSQLCLGALLAVCLASAPVAAQSPDTLHVKLAQSVLVGNTLAPAGDYTVHIIDTGSDTQIAQFVSDTTSLSAGVVVTRVTLDDRAAGRTELVLVPAGDRYRLDKIWLAGKSYGYQASR